MQSKALKACPRGVWGTPWSLSILALVHQGCAPLIFEQSCFHPPIFQAHQLGLTCRGLRRSFRRIVGGVNMSPG